MAHEQVMRTINDAERVVLRRGLSLLVHHRREAVRFWLIICLGTGTLAAIPVAIWARHSLAGHGRASAR